MKQLHWWLAALGLLLYIVLVWFLGSWLHLKGGSLWTLRIALWLIGIAATAVIVYFVTKAEAEALQPAEGETDLRSDIEFLAREANAHLGASQGIRKGARDLSRLPLVLFLGDAGAAKTTVILNSGLEPEQLAGEVYKDGAVIPTRVANLWLGAGATLVESGAALAASPASLRRALDLLRSRTLANLLGRSGQAPRAVVICYECANFIAADARNTVDQAARRLRSLLGDIAHRWGSRLPVYVLFTKLDQVSYFVDYFRNLTPEESSQLFGVTLTPGSGGSVVAYGEQQTRRLNEAFESLFGSLSDRRLDFLRREDDLSKTPNIYEFAREFRKMRDNLVRFLVDVGRPSQLRASPYLRGFYFTGVRPVIVSDGVAPAEPAVVPQYGDDVGATRLFSGPGRGAGRPSPARPLATQGHRVPQWVFLSPFFTRVLLADRAALGASGYDTRAGMIRRGLGAAALAALAIWIIGASASYSNNSQIIRNAATSSQSLVAVRTSPGQTPSLDALRQLEQLRQVAAGAIERQRYGAPMSLRWGVYPGADAYQRPVALYCREFDRLLLADTRASLTDYFLHLPASPNPGDAYQRPFDSLRAYLMATSEAPRTEPAFLASVFTSQWASNRAVPEETASLARSQFAFYASQQPMNLCPSRPDPSAIAQARTYLLAFQPLERIYRSMLMEVSKRGQPYVFSDPAGAIVDGQQVAFPYTKGGWPVMQTAIREVTTYYGHDPWVLGEGGAAGNTSTLDLQRLVRQRYAADYAAQWQQFLNQGAVSPYADIKDAARKLDAMTSPQSSLLRLFCGISVNTSVDAPEVQSGFQPIQQLEPPATCDNKLNDAATQPYMSAMVALQVQVDSVSKSPDASGATLDSANARVAAKTTAQNLNLPPKAGQLLLDPIVNADNSLRGAAPAGVNAKGKQFCDQAASVYQRFPFNAHSNTDAALPDFIAVFQPGMGSLAMFFQNSLQDLLVPGVPFTRKAGAKVNVRPEFLTFFNQASTITRAFFPGNAARPTLAYSVQALPSNDLENFTLLIGGRSLRTFGERQDFMWNGDSVAISLSAKPRSGPAPGAIITSGPWSLFHLLSDADRVSPGAATYEYDIRGSSSIGRQSTTIGNTAVLRLQVEAKGFPGLLGSLATGCVARVAQ